MSLRPRRKAAQKQSYNEDDLFMEENMFEQKVAPKVVQGKDQFDIPRSRIPQPPIIRESPVVVSPPVAKNRLTLKSYLEMPLRHKRCKTSLWKSRKACARDSYSYVKSLENLRIQRTKKRQKKEFFKNLRAQMEKQKLVQQRDSYDFHQQQRQSFSHFEEASIPSFSRNESNPGKVAYSKTNTEAGSNPKLYREDSCKAIEEAEMKSTAISIHEKAPHKDSGSKTYGEMGYNDFNVDQELPQPVHHAPKKVTIDDLNNGESLLDKIFDDHNQEFSDEFLKDSLHYD